MMLKIAIFTAISLCVLSTPPNIVLFLIDDQDLLLNGMKALPKAYNLFANNGIEFVNAFASTPVCCVSRGSILTGKYVHNHQISNNSIFGGCASRKWIKKDESHTYASYLYNDKNTNYRTFFSGKYLNLYGRTDQMPYTHIPEGWTDWYALIGDAVYYDYRLSINGEKREYHGNDGDNDYLPFVMRDKAMSFLSNDLNEDEPFFLQLALPAAHSPWTPPDRYLNVFDDENLKAPATENFNYFNEDGNNNDKGPVLRMQRPMGEKEIKMANKVYAGRHGTLLAVDDIIDEIHNKISDLGRLDNTYFIYASDHGFHIGQYGMWFGKKLLYDTDLRIPFFISGPNIVPGQITTKTALTIDIGPTILDLAIGHVPETMDGESLVQYFNLNEDEETNIFLSDQSFLVEYYGETDIHHQERPEPMGQRIINCPSHTETIGEISCDLWNNTYQCVRVIDGNFKLNTDNIGEIFCQYTCYNDAYEIVECPKGSPESFGEYYDLNKDGWQLTNTYHELSDSQIIHFKSLMDLHLECQGTECQKLRTRNKNNNNRMKVKKNNINTIQIIAFCIFIILCIWAFIFLQYGTICCCFNKKTQLNGVNNNEFNYKYSRLQKQVSRYSGIL